MAEQLSRQQALDILAQEHQIDGSDIYLLELIPLIEVIWADGVAQEPEMDVMRQFVLAHMDKLNEAAGMEIVSNDQVQAFFKRFCDSRPSPDILKTIRELSIAVFLSNPDNQVNKEKSRHILSYCLDIAAASVVDYPYGRRERIIEEEKNMLMDIMTHFQIALDREC